MSSVPPMRMPTHPPQRAVWNTLPPPPAPNRPATTQEERALHKAQCDGCGAARTGLGSACGYCGRLYAGRDVR